MSKTLDNAITFVKLADDLKKMVESGADWETKFDLIWPRVWWKTGLGEEFRDLGIGIDWVDPDADYESDVRAFNEAVQQKANQLRPVVEALEG